MKAVRATCLTCLVASLPFLPHAAGAAEAVRESARRIPVAYDVDVVVVGGSTGAVAAAVEAARGGASVFLAAPRSYLGEDLCATLRLSVDPADAAGTPLAALTGGRAADMPPFAKALPFTYTADRPSSPPHRDTQRQSLLADGRWRAANVDSVQYDGDVTIVADLGGPQQVAAVHVLAFQRAADFRVADVTVATSDDANGWTQAAVVANTQPADQRIEGPPLDLSAAIEARTRYVRLKVRKAEGAKRLLLGEIVIESAAAAAIEPPTEARAGCEAVSEPVLLTPMQVKRAMDELMLAAKARFLFGCYATDVLRDGEGRPAGIVMCNRAGRQAVLAKVIVDATDRAAVARLAGAKFRPYPAGAQTFRRICLGGGPRSGEGVAARRTGQFVASRLDRHERIEYTLQIDMPDASFASFARAEQIARDRTFDPQQVDASEALFQVPPDAMHARAPAEGEWPGATEIGLDAFRPAGVERLYVLGGCADMSRAAAERMLRPGVLMAVGRRIGAAAAAEAKALPAPAGVRLPAVTAAPQEEGDVRELLGGVRPGSDVDRSIPADDRALPVLGQYDVVVIGGGTGGAPAGIGAARRGAKTLVVEYLHELGGVSTAGLINRYYHGNKCGFTLEIDKGVAAVGAAVGAIGKAEWYRQELRRRGADVWFGVLGCGAYVAHGRVLGAVVATPAGRGVVLAKTVIDATGNADVAAAAGAACVFIDADSPAVQGTGLPARALGASVTNTDYTFSDDGDPVDAWQLFLYARQRAGSAYDLGQLIDTRERRRIVGDLVLSPLDEVLRRRFPDTIAIARSDFDSHGYTIHPLFTVEPPGRRSIETCIPFRCLLPRDLQGLLAIGLGISAHRDAIPVIRMQPDVQNVGYAAGVAAAMAAGADTYVRDVDVRALQKHLVEVGNLPERVLTEEDSFPLPAEQVAAAVAKLDGDRSVAIILSQAETALPLLRQAYADEKDAARRLAYARLLGMLGDATGAELLADAVRRAEWDKGWNFRGMGQYAASLSPLDGTIIALGRSGDPRGLPAILEKIRQLDATSEFSHCRAVAVAAETLRSPQAAALLAELLAAPGVGGYAVQVSDQAGGDGDRLTRGDRGLALRELVLARALFRCGDRDGLGERILRQYAADVRGPLARHAAAVLAEKK